MRKLALFTTIAILLAFMAGTIYAAPPGEPPGLERAIAAQEKHNSQLLATQGVVGTAVGLTAKGKPVVKVFTEKAGVTGLPESLDGVSVKVQVSGKIFALKPGQAKRPNKPDKGPKVEEPTTTDIWDAPVPIGISTGNANECSAGTIAARVKDDKGNVYALSNNHVYALENSAPIGSQVLQPGLYDTQCILNGNNDTGTLSDFEPLAFDGKLNYIDAAIALTNTDNLGNSTPKSGYGTPKSAMVAANIGLPVQKFGRTTKLTKGVVTDVNWIGWVGYSSGDALFANQIVVQSGRPFIKSGDSGSMLVTNPDCNPVGLLFAGNKNGRLAIANPIDKVLKEFGVTIDGE